MLVGAKDQLGHRVWTLTQTFVLRSERMSALDQKNKLAGYRCLCVIHNFSYMYRIEPPVNETRRRRTVSVTPSCNKL